MSLNKLNEKIRYFWLLEAVVASVIIGVVIFAALYIFAGGYLGYASVMPVVTAVAAWYGIRRYANWGFEVRDDHLYIEHGVIKKVYSMVPYVRVQHIDTDRGPIDRVLGLSTLRVYTAGSKGADIKVPGLDREDASQLQKKLRDSAINSEKGFDAV
jgi:membrane protein YdbS with pleckstrin-like domain